MIDLSGIIAISGQPGLFKIVAQSKNGIIVEGLADKKRTNVYASTKVSTLSEISMYTSADDKPIEAIMFSVFEKENGGVAVDAKADDKTIAAYFESVLPDYDKERVYVSNMRKLFAWYNILQTTGNLKKKEEKTEEGTEEKIVAPKVEEKAKAKTSHHADNKKAKTSAGVKKTAGVRKTGAA
jgi:hypothetical protein